LRLIPAILLNKEPSVLNWGRLYAAISLTSQKSDSTVGICGKRSQACGKLAEICGKPVESLWNLWGKLWEKIRIAKD